MVLSEAANVEVIFFFCHRCVQLCRDLSKSSTVRKLELFVYYRVILLAYVSSSCSEKKKVAGAGPGGGAGLSSFFPLEVTLADRSGSEHTCSSPMGGWDVLAQGVRTFCFAVCPLPFERSTFPVAKKRAESQ